MAGYSEILLIINHLHRHDNFKKCATRPFACSGFVSQYPERIEFDILYTERYNAILKENE